LVLLLKSADQSDGLRVALESASCFRLGELNSVVLHVKAGVYETLDDHAFDYLFKLILRSLGFLADLLETKSEVSLTEVSDLLLLQSLEYFLRETEIAILLQLQDIFANDLLQE
jgi:hypothetical protein